jgi:hypothetical protein
MTLVSHSLEKTPNEINGVTKLKRRVSTVLPPLESSHSTSLVGDVVFPAFTPGAIGDKIGERSLPKGKEGSNLH